MVFGILAKRLGKFAADNSPAILTAMGVTGALATAYLTGTATFKAAEVLRQEETEALVAHIELAAKRKADGKSESEDEEPIHQGPFRFKDKFELTWKLYVPAAATAAMTVAAIIGANHIGVRRAAALASAYSISEKALDEYKKKVTSKLGEKKAQAITDEIAEDQIRAKPSSKNQIVITSLGDHRCFDRYTGTYFTGDIHQIKTSALDMGYKVLHEGYASLSDWWDMLELPHTQGSDDLGWNQDKKFDIELTYVPDDHDRPCLAIGFTSMPISKFYRFP